MAKAEEALARQPARGKGSGARPVAQAASLGALVTDAVRAVRRALSAVRAAGLWDRCTATDVKAAMEVARGRPDQAKDRGSGGSGLSGQVPRAASWGPATAHSSEPPARSRATSNEPRKHVHLTLNAGPGTIVSINC